MYEKRFQRRRYQTRKLWRRKSWICVRWIQDTMICHAETEERYKRYAHNSIETMLKQNNFELIHWTNQYFGIVTQNHCAYVTELMPENLLHMSVFCSYSCSFACSKEIKLVIQLSSIDNFIAIGNLCVPLIDILSSTCFYIAHSNRSIQNAHYM